MRKDSTPELSVVVPVLNEANLLPDLFATLASQRGSAFELILCDGGSRDGTSEVAHLLGETAPFPCKFIRTLPGRGRQMNAGAAIASGRNLLFLHVDSLFSDPLALSSGLGALEDGIAARGNDRVAGRFALRFRRQVATPAVGYFFYEEKARLNRPGCIHGDQGFLLRRSFFQAIGSYDESLPFLEDDRLAEKVRKSGEWILLPAEIITSARRFETEGLRARQTLNAMIMCMASVGWDGPLMVLPDLYRTRDRSARLALFPFFASIAEMLAALPFARRLALWYRIGAYVRSNAWQLAFAYDQRCRFRGGEDADARRPALDIYDTWIEPLIDHPPGRAIAAALTWSWFHVTRISLRLRAHGINPVRQE